MKYKKVKKIERKTKQVETDKMWHIYKLVDPNDENDVRYIGITTDLTERLLAHIKGDDNRGKTRWINSLVLDYKAPKIVEIGKIYGTKKDANRLEHAYVTEYLKRGCNLYNKAHIPRDRESYIEHLRNAA